MFRLGDFFEFIRSLAPRGVATQVSKHRAGRTGKHGAKARRLAAHKRRNRAERVMRRRNR